LALVAAWLAVAGQLVMLYAPALPVAAGFAFPLSDKLAHCLSFALAAGLWAALSRRKALVAGLFAAHAVASELIQLALPGRSADPWDVAADLAGIGIGLWLAGLAGRLGGGPGPRLAKRGGAPSGSGPATTIEPFAARLGARNRQSRQEAPP
jgi:hypothetical protein